MDDTLSYLFISYMELSVLCMIAWIFKQGILCVKFIVKGLVTFDNKVVTLKETDKISE